MCAARALAAPHVRPHPPARAMENVRSHTTATLANRLFSNDGRLVFRSGLKWVSLSFEHSPRERGLGLSGSPMTAASHCGPNRAHSWRWPMSYDSLFLTASQGACFSTKHNQKFKINIRVSVQVQTGYTIIKYNGIKLFIVYGTYMYVKMN